MLNFLNKPIKYFMMQVSTDQTVKVHTICRHSLNDGNVWRRKTCHIDVQFHSRLFQKFNLGLMYFYAFLRLKGCNAIFRLFQLTLFNRKNYIFRKGVRNFGSAIPTFVALRIIWTIPKNLFHIYVFHDHYLFSLLYLNLLQRL